MKVSLNDFKNHLIDVINNTRVKNVKEQIATINKSLGIVEILLKADMLGDEGSGSPASPVDGNKRRQPNEYIFKKRLAGGTLVGIESYIPESTVRNLGLSSGDVVHVRDTENIAKSIKLVGKTDENLPDDEFTIYPFSPVKKEDGFLYCDEYYSEGRQVLRIDGIPFKYKLPDALVARFGILEGDLLDLGVEKDSPRFIKIIWKHESDNHIIPKPSSHYKKKTDKDTNSAFYGVDYDKRKILVIGCEPRRRYYQDAIESCNGQFLFMSGEESFDRVKSVINDADVIVILKEFLSHVLVKLAVANAKDLDKPFKVADGLGIQTVLFEARKLLSQELQTKE